MCGDSLLYNCVPQPQESSYLFPPDDVDVSNLPTDNSEMLGGPTVEVPSKRQVPTDVCMDTPVELGVGDSGIMGKTPFRDFEDHMEDSGMEACIGMSQCGNDVKAEAPGVDPEGEEDLSWMSYRDDHIEEVETSRGTFRWPVSSTPEKTERILKHFKLHGHPLNANAWECYLRDHPEPLWVKQLVRGIREGFPLGYIGPRTTFIPEIKPLNPEEMELMDKEFAKELEKGRMLGPFETPPEDLFHFYRVSPSFLIPKEEEGEWRRIDDMSRPNGKSINDGISTEGCAVNYATLNQMVETLATLPKGTLMSKRDIASAYRQVLVNPSDWPLLALTHRNSILINYFRHGWSQFVFLF